MNKVELRQKLERLAQLRVLCEEIDHHRECTKCLTVNEFLGNTMMEIEREVMNEAVSLYGEIAKAYGTTSLVAESRKGGLH